MNLVYFKGGFNIMDVLISCTRCGFQRRSLSTIQHAAVIKMITKCYGDDYGNTEENHQNADDILCEVLRQLGFDELVAEFNKITKYYS